MRTPARRLRSYICNRNIDGASVDAYAYVVLLRPPKYLRDRIFTSISLANLAYVDDAPTLTLNGVDGKREASKRAACMHAAGTGIGIFKNLRKRGKGEKSYAHFLRFSAPIEENPHMSEFQLEVTCLKWGIDALCVRLETNQTRKKAWNTHQKKGHTRIERRDREIGRLKVRTTAVCV